MTDPTSIDADPFYQSYERRGEGVKLKRKHVRQFQKDFVEAAAARPEMSILELGCGNGLFLSFLRQWGAKDVVGVDGDRRVLGEMPPEIAVQVTIADFRAYFAATTGQRRFDRVVMFDVFEHFSPLEGVALLKNIAPLLAPGGRIVIRVPNMASPFALSVQFNDVTHRNAYTPGSLRQVAQAAGCKPLAFRPQAYGTWTKEVRERMLTGVLSWFLSSPPMFWTPNLIAVLTREGDD